MPDSNKLSPEIFNTELSNLEKLATLFPSAVRDGQLDIAALREELGEFEEVGAEKYELTWSGKQKAKKEAQSDIVGRTVKYVPEDSKDADTTQNLYIEGDNLEVLKLLRQNYYGAVKMIYIDPPYNTGNDFIYRDDFTMSSADSNEAEGETVDGERMIVNQKTSNRYHANWLNMMYPRLRVAKDLLRGDGVIFISIDDNEEHNLRKICDEIFGVDCFVCATIWRSSDNSNNDAKQFSSDHNVTLIYSKQTMWQPEKSSNESKQTHFKNPDNDPRGAYFDGNPLNSPNFRENLIYDLITPSGKVIKPPKNGWRWSQETMQKKMDTGEIRFNEDETNIRRRTYLCDMSGLPPSSLWVDLEETGHNRQGKYELLKLMPEDIFDTPKPTKLIKFIVGLVPNWQDGDIIMDFFSGSGTTADAVMQYNSIDNIERIFLLVQLPENLDISLEKAANDKKQALKNAIALCDENDAPHYLSEIAKERIRRAGEKIKEEIEKENQQLKLDEEPKQVPDIGFKVFRVADTNIRWTHEALQDGQLEFDEAMLSDKERLDFMPGFTDIDVVYEVLLRQRDIPLSSKVEKLGIGSRTYIFADAYIVCLDEDVTKEMVEELAAVEPTPIKYVFRDSAFNDDISLKDETVRRLEAYINRNSGDQKRAYTVEFI